MLAELAEAYPPRYRENLSVGPKRLNKCPLKVRQDVPLP